MFLKLTTVFAILGILAHFFLWIVQQLIIGFRLIDAGTMWVVRAIDSLQICALNLPLLLFFVAFFLSLRAKPSAN